MKIEVVLAPLCALAVAWPVGQARAERPPVEIEIVDEADDFFTGPAPKAKVKVEEKKADDEDGEGEEDEARDVEAEAAAIERARSAGGSVLEQDRDAAFEELEALESAKSAGKPLGGAGDRPARGKATKGGAERGVERDGAATSDGTGAREDAAPEGSAEAAWNYGISTWTSWWEREESIREGDLVVGYRLGGWGGGAYHGLSIEGVFSDWGGLALTVHGAFQHDMDRGDGWHRDRWEGRSDRLDFFLGGETVGPTLADGETLDYAVLHMEDLVLNWRWGDGRGFDFTPSFGVGHFGYDVKTGAGDVMRGGSGFLRVGFQLSYVHKRFLAGLDMGWYPRELFRYTLEQRGPHGHLDVVEQEIGDRTDWRRMTSSLFVGATF
ncbi:hypothetical protein L6R52_43145 [Myxococcota bacterium]|nr:hypothetical protein [Myxococcota bacterium]